MAELSACAAFDGIIILSHVDTQTHCRTESISVARSKKKKKVKSEMSEANVLYKCCQQWVKASNFIKWLFICNGANILPITAACLAMGSRLFQNSMPHSMKRGSFDGERGYSMGNEAVRRGLLVPELVSRLSHLARWIAIISYPDPIFHSSGWITLYRSRSGGLIHPLLCKIGSRYATNKFNWRLWSEKKNLKFLKLILF